MTGEGGSWSATGWLLLRDTASATEACRLGFGTVRVESGVIVGVEERAAPGATEADISREDDAPLIMPGLCDGHVHLPQFDSMGVAGLELLDWLDRVIFPAEMRWADTGYAAAMAARVARGLASFGTTCVNAFATVHPASTQAAIDALGDAGLRGLVGHVLMDRGAPTPLISRAHEGLDAVGGLRVRGGIGPAVAPRFAVACSAGLLRGSAEAARAAGLKVHTHLAETTRECALVRELFGGAGYVEAYDDCGILQPGAILAHAIHLSDADRATLARRGCVVAHCPTANRFLDAGVMDRAAVVGAGIGVLLGSDVAGGPDRSMVRVARAMLEAAGQARGAGTMGGPRPATLPTAAHAWATITHVGPALLGLGDTGALAPGMRADIVIATPDLPGWAHAANPLSTLLYAWDDRWIERTFARGAVAYARRS